MQNNQQGYLYKKILQYYGFIVNRRRDEEYYLINERKYMDWQKKGKKKSVEFVPTCCSCCAMKSQKVSNKSKDIKTVQRSYKRPRKVEVKSNKEIKEFKEFWWETNWILVGNELDFCGKPIGFWWETMSMIWKRTLCIKPKKWYFKFKHSFKYNIFYSWKNKLIQLIFYITNYYSCHNICFC